MPAGGGQGLLHLGQIAEGGTGRRIPAVGEHMQRRDGALLAAQLGQGDEVAQLTVNPPIRDQPQQMQGPALGRGPAGGGDQDLVTVEGVIGDGVIDQDQVLADHAPGTQGDVPHLGIAHLAIGQSYRPSRGLQAGMGIEGEIAVEMGCARQGDGIVRLGGIDAETIQDHQQDGTAGDSGPVGHYQDSGQ